MYYNILVCNYCNAPCYAWLLNRKQSGTPAWPVETMYNTPMYSMLICRSHSLVITIPIQNQPYTLVHIVLIHLMSSFFFLLSLSIQHSYWLQPMTHLIQHFIYFASYLNRIIPHPTMTKCIESFNSINLNHNKPQSSRSGCIKITIKPTSTPSFEQRAT